MEEITYRGIKFRRYPDSDNRTERVYFTPGTADRLNGVGRLHQEIYKDHYGPIPDGYHVHHIDDDPLNNSPENLAIVPDSEHVADHSRRWHATNPQESQAHMDHMQKLAAAWHRSDEGRAWHREHGKRTWENRPAVSKQCDSCGSTFVDKTLGNKARFCSNKCKTRWRRAVGLDRVERICAICGSEFTTNKYGKARTCSRSCRYRLRSL